MKSEKLLYAMGEIEEELVFDAMEMPVKGRRNWVRWAVLIACLCLLLAIPALAWAEELLVRFFPGKNIWAFYTQTRFREEEFSPEFLERCGEFEEQAGVILLESLEEAEALIGIALPRNSLLADAGMEKIHLQYADGSEHEGCCMVQVWNNEDRMPMIVLSQTEHVYNGADLFVSYSLATEWSQYSSGSAVGFIPNEEALTQNDLEMAATADGREYAIVIQEGVISSSGYTGYGYMGVDGVMVCLIVNHDAEEAVREILTELLNAYE